MNRSGFFGRIGAAIAGVAAAAAAPILALEPEVPALEPDQFSTGIGLATFEGQAYTHVVEYSDGATSLMRPGYLSDDLLAWYEKLDVDIVRVTQYMYSKPVESFTIGKGIYAR